MPQMPQVPVVPSNPPSNPPRRILFATKFTPGATAAWKRVVSLAQKHRARLTVLTVLGGTCHPADRETYRSAYRAGMRHRTNLTPMEVAGDCQFEYLVDFGPMADAVVRNAWSEDADLIVISGCGEAGRRRSPIVKRVASSAPCPVVAA